MLGGLVVIMPIVVGLVALAITLAAVPGRRRQVAVDEVTYPGLRALRAKATWSRVVGVTLGLAGAWAVTGLESTWTAHGRGLMLAPVVFGIVVLAVVAVGDLLARDDARAVSTRASALDEDDRTVRRLVPRALTRGVAVVGALLVAVLSVGWWLGAADTTGETPGSSLQWSSPDGMFGGGSGPWPGSYYGSVAIPAALLLVATLGLGLLVTRSRPRDGRDREIRRVDAIIRRREIETLVAAAGVALSVLTFGLSVTAAVGAAGLRSGARLNGYDPGVAYDIGAWLGLAAALVALVVGVWSAVSLLVPGPAAPRGRRTAAATASKVPA